MKIAVVGPGRMGGAVAHVARESGHEIVAEIGAGGLSPDAVRHAQVAIEFTLPGAARANLERLAELGVPTVTGTTGWYDALPEIGAAFEAAGVGLVYAPNFSLGALLMTRLVGEAGRLMAGRPEFSAWLVETHHAGKLDAPSGTAERLRQSLRQADPDRDYPVTSLRGGTVPGTHELVIDAAGEELVLRHAARDRSIFARGAVLAAQWLIAEPRRGAFDFGTSILGPNP